MKLNELKRRLKFNIIGNNDVIVAAIDSLNGDVGYEDTVLELSQRLKQPEQPNLADELLIGVSIIDPDSKKLWKDRMHLVGVIKIALPHNGKYLLYWGSSYMDEEFKKLHHSTAFDMVRHIAMVANREIIHYRNDYSHVLRVNHALIQKDFSI